MNINDFLEKFIEIALNINDTLNLSDITLSTPIQNLGIDSMQLMEIMGEIQDYFDVVFPEAELMKIKNLADIQELIIKYKN